MKRKIALLVIAIFAICLCLSSCVSECEHVFEDFEIDKAPTCVESGSKFVKCTICSRIQTDTIEALGHDMKMSSVRAPTCTEKGYTDYVCSSCGFTEMADVVSAIDHNYKVSKVQSPTCTESGYTDYICSVCGIADKGDFVLDKRVRHIRY